MHVPSLIEWCWRQLESNPQARDYMTKFCNVPVSPGKFWPCMRCSRMCYSETSFKPRVCQQCRTYEYERIVQSWIHDLNEFQSEMDEFGFCVVICRLCQRHMNTKCNFFLIFQMCVDCFDVCIPEIKTHLIHQPWNDATSSG